MVIDSELIGAKINVPFSDKELAKKLGATWDTNEKSWCIGNNSDLLKIGRWFSPIFDRFKEKSAPKELSDLKIVKAYYDIPIRFNTLDEALRLLGVEKSMLVYGSGMFCPMCDSQTSSNEWMVNSKGTHIELRHYLFHGNINKIVFNQRESFKLRELLTEWSGHNAGNWFEC